LKNNKLQMQVTHRVSSIKNMADSATVAISADDLPLNLQAAEVAVVKRALVLANGNVSEAGRMLGINRMKVYRILAQEEE